MLERYDVIISEGAPDPMLPQVEGDWVRYADAQATIADLQGQLKAQAEEYEQVEQCLDEQISGLNQGNLDYEKKIAALQQRVAQLEGEIEAVEHFYQMEKQRDTALLRWQVKEALAASLPAQPAQGGA